MRQGERAAEKVSVLKHLALMAKWSLLRLGGLEAVVKHAPRFCHCKPPRVKELAYLYNQFFRSLVKGSWVGRGEGINL